MWVKEAGAISWGQERKGTSYCSVREYHNDIYEANISFQFGDTQSHSLILEILTIFSSTKPYCGCFPLVLQD